MRGPDTSRSQKYAVFAVCERWQKIMPWEFARLTFGQQMDLLAWEDLRNIEAAMD